MSREFDSLTREACTCGIPQRLAEDQRYSVIHDEMSGEYQFKSINGHWVHTMRLCLWCGGQLDSDRSSRSSEPDPAEREEVRRLLAGAKTIPDVIARICPPDETVDLTNPDHFAIPVVQRDGPKRTARSAHHYRRRWKSRILVVIEHDDSGTSQAIAPSARRTDRRS